VSGANGRARSRRRSAPADSTSWTALPPSIWDAPQARTARATPSCSTTSRPRTSSRARTCPRSP